MRDDTRAVSVAVTHALMLGVTTLLIIGLVIGTGTMLETQNERAAQQQIDEVGADILGHVDSLDRLNRTGETVATSVRLDYPATIGGEPYTVSLAEESGPYETDWTLQVDTGVLDRIVYFPVPDGTTLETSSARGDEPVLALCRDGTIRFGGC